MRNSIVLFIVFALLGGAAMTSCDTSAQKLKKAQDAEIEANADLVKANQEYLADMESYKKETDARIAANQKSIADFEARVSKEKKEIKAEYTQKIADLEQKNSDLRKKLDDYKAAGKEQWDSFKTEFSNDLDELGKSLKDLTVDNTDK